MSRRLAHVSHRTPTKAPSAKAPVDLVTYRHEGEMVYVNPGPDYDGAITCALENFPSLSDVPQDRIAFFVNVRVGGKSQKVRISRNAWAKVLSSLSTYEIIEIAELPRPMLRPAKSDTDVRTHNFEDPEDEKAYFRAQLDVPPLYNPVKYSQEGTDSNNSHLLQPPRTEPIKRASSALGWFEKHFS